MSDEPALAPSAAAESHDVVTRLYSSLARRDHEAMAACYADDATFSDPVFHGLQGIQVKGMWRMLCERAADLQVTFEDVRVDATSGAARWRARYTFPSTKRPVSNIVDARFTLREGRIASHVDTFNFWWWASMALGPQGALLGWSPLVRKKVRTEAMKGLELFMKRKRMV